MRSYYQSKPVSTAGLVATIGVFDGVHVGHRSLILAVRQEAENRGIESAVITFSSSPSALFDPNFVPQSISDPKEKESLFKDAGVDVCITLDFNQEIAVLTAEEFFCKLLVPWNVKCLVVGYDHRFGRGRAEGMEDYVRYGAAVGIDVVQASVFLLDGKDKVSSSKVRSLIRKGAVSEVSRYLGRAYTLSGKVTEGFQIGTSIGFPTANIVPLFAEKIVPGKGVYAIRAKVNGKVYGGMLNIGTRPTFHKNAETSIEANLFDFSGDIYNQEIEISFISRLREERKYETIDQLQEQMRKDKLATEGYLKELL